MILFLPYFDLVTSIGVWYEWSLAPITFPTIVNPNKFSL